jgi:hypothetical protein
MWMVLLIYHAQLMIEEQIHLTLQATPDSDHLLDQVILKGAVVTARHPVLAGKGGC